MTPNSSWTCVCVPGVPGGDRSDSGRRNAHEPLGVHLRSARHPAVARQPGAHRRSQHALEAAAGMDAYGCFYLMGICTVQASEEKSMALSKNDDTSWTTVALFTLTISNRAQQESSFAKPAPTCPPQSSESLWLNTQTRPFMCSTISLWLEFGRKKRKVSHHEYSSWPFVHALEYINIFCGLKH